MLGGGRNDLRLLLAGEAYVEHERVAADIRSRRAWETAGSLAREPRILNRFAPDLERAGVVGEERAGKLLYLALTSRFFARPASVAAKGPSSSGKSITVETVCEFFPPDAYYALTAMSERSLAYGTEPLRHRFLVLYEAAGLESDFASYLIRSLLSEGRVRYETVEKTRNGLEPRLIEREGPTGLIVTTTAVSLHAENETRLVSVTVTDTPAQTKSVLLAIATERTPPDLSAWRDLQTWLAGAEHRVDIPYASILAELVPPVARFGCVATSAPCSPLSAPTRCSTRRPGPATTTAASSRRSTTTPWYTTSSPTSSPTAPKRQSRRRYAKPWRQ
jgi:hypothetical protein